MSTGEAPGHVEVDPARFLGACSPTAALLNDSVAKPLRRLDSRASADICEKNSLSATDCGRSIVTRNLLQIAFARTGARNGKALRPRSNTTAAEVRQWRADRVTPVTSSRSSTERTRQRALGQERRPRTGRGKLQAGNRREVGARAGCPSGCRIPIHYVAFPRIHPPKARDGSPRLLTRVSAFFVAGRQSVLSPYRTSDEALRRRAGQARSSDLYDTFLIS